METSPSQVEQRGGARSKLRTLRPAVASLLAVLVLTVFASGASAATRTGSNTCAVSGGTGTFTLSATWSTSSSGASVALQRVTLRNQTNRTVSTFVVDSAPGGAGTVYFPEQVIPPNTTRYLVVAQPYRWIPKNSWVYNQVRASGGGCYAIVLMGS